MLNLERFQFYLADIESPSHFIDWNFFYLISSTLARRVWVGIDFPTYPNQFLIFVAPPATGKSLPASKTTEILQSMVDLRVEGSNVYEKRLVNISPNSVTLEALYEELANSVQSIKICDDPPKVYIHSSTSFCIGDELGTLFRDKQNDLITFLTQAWDCGTKFYRKTKSNGEVNILNMCVNFLGCCTGDWMATHFNSGLMEMGFSSRVIFFFADKPRKRTTILNVTADQRAALKELKTHLRNIVKLCGEVKFSPTETPEAFEWFDDWVQNKQDKHINKDKRMIHYYGRKKRHLIKLAMIMHFSDKTSLQLDREDFEE